MTTVLLTGTFASGKTTLLRLIEPCPLVATVAEVARDLLARLPEMQGEAVFQDLVLTEQMRRDIVAQNTGAPIVICDRGMIDIRAYSSHFGHLSPVPPVGWHYDRIFFCAAEDIPASAIPPERAEMRQAIDACLREELQLLEMDYVVLRGTPTERLETLARAIATDCRGSDRKALLSWLERRLGVRTKGVPR
ncbi:MAG: ATP-binding protein [Actinomycetota bacterium]|nr:ATP-binding protein [Actinomycetota bacterium]